MLLGYLLSCQFNSLSMYCLVLYFWPGYALDQLMLFNFSQTFFLTMVSAWENLSDKLNDIH